MSIKIQNNLMALNAQRNSQLNSLQLQSSLAKLSSGLRINKAADDAAGLSISELMRAQLTGTQRAIMNAQDGVSMVQTAEGAMGEMHSMLNRLSELAVQGSSSILNGTQRGALQAEADSLMAEIDRISRATNFNGVNLLDGSLSSEGAGMALKGLEVTRSGATPGSYEFDALQGQQGLATGDTIDFSLKLNDGNTVDVQFTVDAGAGTLTADGKTYDLAATADQNGNISVTGEELATALADQFAEQGLDASFDIARSGDALTLTAKEAGTDAVQVSYMNQTVDGVQTSVNAAVTVAGNESATIARDAFTVYDGSNTDAATFTVNGEKFALVQQNDFGNASRQFGADVNLITVSARDGAQLSTGDLQKISARVNYEAGTAFEADANGITMNAPGGEALKLQVGDTADAYNQINVSIQDMSSAGLGLRGLDLTTQDGALRAMDSIRTAIDRVSSTRGDLGATQNRLEYTMTNLGVQYENLTAAESRIRDADMAKMFMDFTKQSILGQVSQAMQAQSNMQAHQVLQLLR